MTYFLDFRTRDVGGAAIGPNFFEGDGTAAPLALTFIAPAQVPSVVAGKNLLFATHGFNVSRPHGAYSLGALDAYLALPAPNLFIGMLWPGDSWLPIVDYPFEGDVALDCGQRLAAFCNTLCTTAQSLSFVSHSLGARLVLEAVSRLGAKAQSVCLTAGAINDDCLSTEYAAATGNSARISMLASHRDLVLKVAFSVGDPFADLLHDDHAPFRAALGASGPRLPVPQPPVSSPWQIPNDAGYGHGNYLPPGEGPVLPVGALWPQAADFMKRAFLGQPQIWPP